MRCNLALNFFFRPDMLTKLLNDAIIDPSTSPLCHIVCMKYYKLCSIICKTCDDMIIWVTLHLIKKTKLCTTKSVIIIPECSNYKSCCSCTSSLLMSSQKCSLEALEFPLAEKKIIILISSIAVSSLSSDRAGCSLK